MKEVMAIIRMNKIGETKEALPRKGMAPSLVVRFMVEARRRSTLN